ncbi:MAG: enoyl-CoA hydratase-related protein [Candidatus Neomarinimicrobiota bacterium]
MSYILTEIADYIATITINRPDALNAMNLTVIGELRQAVIDCIADKNVGVIIITGAGEKAFVAGADIKAMAKMTRAEALEFGQAGHGLLNTIENSPKPVIAAVNGFALGGGTEISLACHIRLASENAVFGQPEVKLGLIPGWGGTQRLTMLVGKGMAVELIAGGGTINSAEALRIGLVNRVVPLADLLPQARKLAQSIVGNGPEAVRIALDCIRQGQDLSLTAALEYEVQAFSRIFETSEMQEGTIAFVEKRAPKFR